MIDYLRVAELVVALVAALTVGSCAVGCNPSADDILATQVALQEQVNKATSLPKDMAQISDALIGLIKDQGVIEDFILRGRGHGLNPGLGVTLRQEQSMIVHLDGVDVDVSAETQGTGTSLPSGVREKLIEVLAGLENRTDPEAVALRNQIIQILGWNRTPIPNN
jgi:hypothetical protein